LLLGLIRWRESGGDYSAPPKNPPYATASGAYQFITATWRQATLATGVGGKYPMAYLAPPDMQDANALWLLRMYGANSSHAWRASGPYPLPAELSYALAGEMPS
jgi:hypothetical protein